jgi:hypothetical protein
MNSGLLVGSTCSRWISGSRRIIAAFVFVRGFAVVVVLWVLVIVVMTAVGSTTGEMIPPPIGVAGSIGISTVSVGISTVSVGISTVSVGLRHVAAWSFSRPCPVLVVVGRSIVVLVRVVCKKWDDSSKISFHTSK